GESLHLLTVTSGELELGCGDERLRLKRFDTALVAGGAGAYRLRGLGGEARLLRASVPPG
ncbi:MAG: type I phosphomannose isomerase catalytic subunit, partial [Deinococcus sp.]